MHFIPGDPNFQVLSAAPIIKIIPPALEGLTGKLR
jgi:hypothetical protein